MRVGHRHQGINQSQINYIYNIAAAVKSQDARLDLLRLARGAAPARRSAGVALEVTRLEYTERGPHGEVGTI